MKTVSLRIGGGQSALNPTELAEFLFLFKGTVTGLRRMGFKGHDFNEPNRADIERAKAGFRKLSPNKINGLFEDKDNLIKVDKITHNSPIDIFLGALAGAVCVVAGGVVLSGGKIKISKAGMEAVLPPLGKGIRYLRQALGLDKTLQVGYGIQEVKIKLTKAQYRELMKPVVGTGGFQSFLTALQHRINKNTRELVLTREDLERIYKAKAHPEAGGWQQLFCKVFGSHLPDAEPHVKALPAKKANLITQGSSS